MSFILFLATLMATQASRFSIRSNLSQSYSNIKPTIYLPNSCCCSGSNLHPKIANYVRPGERWCIIRPRLPMELLNSRDMMPSQTSSQNNSAQYFIPQQPVFESSDHLSISPCEFISYHNCNHRSIRGRNPLSRSTSTPQDYIRLKRLSTMTTLRFISSLTQPNSVSDSAGRQKRIDDVTLPVTIQLAALPVQQPSPLPTRSPCFSVKIWSTLASRMNETEFI